MTNPFIITISFWYNDNPDMRYTTLSRDYIFPLISFSRKTDDLSLLTDKNVFAWTDSWLSKLKVDAYPWNFQRMGARNDRGLWWDFLIYKDKECTWEPIGVWCVDATLLDKVEDFRDDLKAIFQ